MEITWIVLWSDILTRHNNLKQLSITEKGKTKSRRIRTAISVSSTVWKITTLVCSWSWLNWRLFNDRGALFFKIIYFKFIRGQMDKDCITFHVSVRCEKCVSHVQIVSHSTITAYQKHDQNICCFSILEYALKTSNQLASEK